MNQDNNFNFQGNSGVPNNQPLNNKTPKKINGLIFGVVGAVAVIAGIFLLLNQNNNNGIIIDMNKDLTGNLELIKKSEETITTNIVSLNNDLTHFKIYHDDEETVIDSNGNTVFSSEDGPDFYLGEDYYLGTEDFRKVHIIKNNEIVFEYNTTNTIVDTSTYSYVSYSDDVLYYTTTIDTIDYVVAYNLKTKKELWKTEGANPILLENGYISVSLYDSYRILDKSGNIIASAENDFDIYPTFSDHYFKVVEDVSVEVYDYFGNKISTLSLVDNERWPNFFENFSNGMYVIREYDRISREFVYKVYNKNSELVIELPDCHKSALRTSLHLNDGSKSILIEIDEYESNIGAYKNFVIYSDETIETLYNIETNDGSLGFMMGGYTATKKHYVSGVAPSSDSNNSYGIKIINLDNKKSEIVVGGVWSTSIDESPNGKYVIVNYNNSSKKKYVLDENLETIYETDNQLEVVNDKYVIEYNIKTKNEMYLVNVFTKEKKKLETTGNYYKNNVAGLITYDGTNYYLYAFK